MLELVSVITVCYNSSTTISETLESVRSQTWPFIEHIVIDGASTDGTQSLIAKNNTRITYFVSEADKGIYDAMNKGLAQATGDIVCFLNSDDVYASPDVVANVVTRMNEHDLEALYGDVVFFNASRPNLIVRRYRSSTFTPKRLAWGWMPAHPALFLTADVFRRIGSFDTRYKIAGDFDLVIRAFWNQQIRAGYTPEVLVRMQNGGISTRTWRSKFRLNMEVLAACRRNGVSTNPLMILSKYPLKMLELFFRR